LPGCRSWPIVSLTAVFAPLLQKTMPAPLRGSMDIGRRPSRPPRAPRASLPVQAKLEVGPVDDPLEREADRAAAAVASRPAAEPRIARQCADCEAEEMLRPKPAGPPAAAGPAPAIVHQALGSPGRPLDAAARAYFEPRFGQDFSRVRVHADELAAAS